LCCFWKPQQIAAVASYSLGRSKREISFSFALKPTFVLGRGFDRSSYRGGASPSDQKPILRILNLLVQRRRCSLQGTVVFQSRRIFLQNAPEAGS
jgi:hypothetical protein